MLALLLAALTIAAGGATGWEPSIGDRVRIQADELGPDWHSGFLNRTRTEPVCYVVLIFAPRASREEAQHLLATIPVSRITRLQVTSAPGSSMQEWGGHPDRVPPEDSWRDVDLAPLRPPSGKCRFDAAV